MTADTFTPDKPYSRKLTDYQQKLLDTVMDFGGDALKAAKATGHSDPRKLIESVKDELIEMANSVLAMHSLKAAMKLGEVMDSDQPITQVEAKLKAAQMILDRTNPKTEKVDVTGDIKTGLIILPSKKADDNV
jgi:hypothetical protein